MNILQQIISDHINDIASLNIRPAVLKNALKMCTAAIVLSVVLYFSVQIAIILNLSLSAATADSALPVELNMQWTELPLCLTSSSTAPTGTAFSLLINP